MAGLNQKSPDALCSEILETAHRSRDEMLAGARSQVERILRDARDEALRMRQQIRNKAEAEASHHRDRILATVAVEIGRMRSARIEAILESIHEEVRRRLLANNSINRETTVVLAAEAIRKMPDNDFVVEIPCVDRSAVGDQLAEEIIKQVGRAPLNVSISMDGAVFGAGVVVRDAHGHQFWDNRLISRLERLWPELRRQIAIQASLATANNSSGGTT